MSRSDTPRRRSPGGTAAAMMVACSLAFVVLALLDSSGWLIYPAVRTAPAIALTTLAAAFWLVTSRPAARIRNGAGWVLATMPGWAFHGALFVLGTALFAVLGFGLFQGVPHMDDGVASLFQARIFASGAWCWPIDPSVRRFFDLFGVIDVAGHPELRCGMYPPGWPGLLAVAVLLRAPWLVNPVLGGALAVAVSALGQELFDRRVGRLAGLLVVTSPLVGLISATHLSHTSTALGCTLAWWSAARLAATGRARHAALAAAAQGVAFLCRPVTAVLIGMLIVAGLAPRLLRLLASWRVVIAVLLPLLVAGGLLAAFQEATTGSPLTMGHEREMRSAAHVGFGPIPGSPRVYTPRLAVQHSAYRLAALNRELLGWPVATFLVALAPFLLLRAGRRDVLLLAPLGALLGFHALYWYFEEYFPGR